MHSIVVRYDHIRPSSGRTNSGETRHQTLIVRGKPSAVRVLGEHENHTGSSFPQPLIIPGTRNEEL